MLFGKRGKIKGQIEGAGLGGKSFGKPSWRCRRRPGQERGWSACQQLRGGTLVGRGRARDGDPCGSFFSGGGPGCDGDGMQEPGLARSAAWPHGSLIGGAPEKATLDRSPLWTVWLRERCRNHHTIIRMHGNNVSCQSVRPCSSLLLLECDSQATLE